MQPYTAQDIIDLTNQYRKEQGLPALKSSPILMQAAQKRADDISKSTYWSHETKGKKYYQLMDELGYKRQYAGENLARGFNSANDILTALKNSPTHNDNLIKSNYQDTGVAIMQGADKKYYVVQFFGNQKPEGKLQGTVVPKKIISQQNVPKKVPVDYAEIRRLQGEAVKTNSAWGLTKETIKGVPKVIKNLGTR